MYTDQAPVTKDLVLIGGGHSHAIALRMFGMHLLPGLRITLITEASDTPYSGMLPGHIAGFYSREDAHIDLRSLAQFAGAQLYIDRVIGLNLKEGSIKCAQRPPVSFDLVSIDIGSTPAIPGLTGLEFCGIPVKPVRQFLRKWYDLLEDVRSAPEVLVCLSIIGGGAGGVELALTMQHHLQRILAAEQKPVENLKMHLFQRQAELMPGHSAWVRHRFQKIMAVRGIELHLRETVQAVAQIPAHNTLHNTAQYNVQCESGLTIKSDRIFWVTQASAPDWIAKSGLATDQRGFIQVGDTLQSVSHPQVFAAGDIATMVNHIRPKSGVFAVRQGKPLFENLRRLLSGKSLKSYQPQQQYLSLIGTGDGSAIASWGGMGWQSPLLWAWKDRIDRTFMAKFKHLPRMSNSPPPAPTNSDSISPTHFMRCAGCGSKVGSPTLERVMQRLRVDHANRTPRSEIVIGLESPDDAAVIAVPDGMIMVQTVDYFRALINDPFTFGQIAANHCLSDIFAMGASPHSALAIASVPYAQAAKVEETLYQLMSGAIAVLHETNADLIGGHTSEGMELAFGLSCNGLARRDHLLTKGGMCPGQVLILTKPLGTGTLFAAAMQRKAKASWIDDAVESMLKSNRLAAEVLLAAGATACTDVTGFGLIGHLLEMITAARINTLAVELELASIPLLPGAISTVEMGIVSSLQAQNLSVENAVHPIASVIASPIASLAMQLLFDPQTSGGLLAAISPEGASDCLGALQNQGYHHARIIGQSVLAKAGTKPIQVI